ncbi:PilW family protein [Nitrosomonas sp. ANs5]|uniref:PilW family protein n=1 Tax=Nitrosomonas sp. ANs5 TaxID=3423941 RepID=UPI003D34A7F5
MSRCAGIRTFIRKERGLTLVEMMVALTIGLVLLEGLSVMLFSSQRTYRVNEALARIQENARYAFQILSRDIRMAGYQGCGGSDAGLNNTLDNATDFLWNFGLPLEGFEAIGSSAWMPALPSSAGTIPSPLGGRDIIVVRGVDGGENRVLSHPESNPPGAADLKVSAGGGLEVGDIVLVADCVAAAIFQVTHRYVSAGQDILAHDTGTGAPGNRTRALGKTYPDGEVMRMQTRTYYIRNNPNKMPALYWKRGTMAAEELIEGVQNMQIQYGEDLDGNRSADVYRSADQVVDWGTVVSVRISLLMQSLEDGIVSYPQTYRFNGLTTTATDRRLRRTFSTVIALRNRTS